MQDMLQVIWFPVVAMLAVVALVVWAMTWSRGHRQRDTLVVKRPVVIAPASDSREDDNLS